MKTVMKNLNRKAFLLTLVCRALFALNGQTLNYEYAVTAGSTSSEEANSIVTDTAGNVFMTGKFSGTVDFDPGTGVTNLISKGFTDAFVAKYDAGGNLVWANSYGNNAFDEGNKIQVDEVGRVYISGVFSKEVDFDAGNDSFKLTALTHTRSGRTIYSHDVFILALNSDGSFRWARQYGLPGVDRNTDLTIDKSGNVIISGVCSNDQSLSDSVDMDPGSGTTWFKGGGAFIAKYSPSGAFLWTGKMGRWTSASSFQYFYNAEIRGVVSSSKNEIIAVGYFDKDVDFDFFSGTEIRNSSKWFVNNQGGQNKDGFVAVYDRNGKFKYVNTFGSTAGPIGCEFSDVAVDTNDAVYVSGAMFGSIDFDPSADTALLTSAGTQSKFDAVILKYSKTGVYRWGKLMGGNADDKALSLQVNSSGEVYSTGYFNGTADFNPASGKYNLHSAGSSDVFISKLNRNGRFSWARSFGSSLDDMAWGIALKQSENTDVYTCGYYNSTCDFNQESGTDYKTSNGSRDLFLHKLTESCTAPSLPGIQTTSTAICYGSGTTLSVGSASLGDAADWEWYSGSCGGTSVGTGSSITVSPLATTTYYVRGEGGCVAVGACSNQQIIVNSIPSGSVYGTYENGDQLQAQTVYFGADGYECAVLNATSVTSGASVTWYQGSNLLAAGSAAITVCPTATTTYTMTVSKNGCSSNVDYEVNVNDVRCGNGSSKVKICHEGKTICISGNALSAHLGHGDHIGECESGQSQAAPLSEPSKTKSVNEVPLFHLYPNPVSDLLTVEVMDMNERSLAIKISNLKGEILQATTKQISESGNASKIILDLNHLISGYYHIEITGERGRYVYPLVRL